MNVSALVETAVRAVVEAGLVCRSVGRDIDRLRTITKNDRSPVTVADFASQAVVIRRLVEGGVTAPIVAEESADALRDPSQRHVLDEVVRAVRTVWSDAAEGDVLEAIDLGQAREVSDAFWTLDPIDGTKGFLRGQQYAVSLGLIVSGQPVLGALGCPNLPGRRDAPLAVADSEGCVYVARAGEGLWETSFAASDERRRIDAKRGPRAENTVIVVESVESGHSKHDATAKLLASLGRPSRVLRLDSQAKYAVVARGQADLYIRMPTRVDYREAIWDHAAGALVAQEGGCVISDVTGKPLDFSQVPRLLGNRGVVCASPDVHAAVIDAISALQGPEVSG